jgi:hypothetical protein
MPDDQSIVSKPQTQLVWSDVPADPPSQDATDRLARHKQRVADGVPDPIIITLDATNLDAFNYAEWTDARGKAFEMKRDQESLSE